MSVDGILRCAQDDKGAENELRVIEGSVHI